MLYIHVCRPNDASMPALNWIRVGKMPSCGGCLDASVARKRAAIDSALIVWEWFMMTSLNGNIFHVTGPLWGESTGHQWIPLAKPVTQNFDIFIDLCLNKVVSKQSRRWSFEMPFRSLWRHCDGAAAVAFDSYVARKRAAIDSVIIV